MAKSKKKETVHEDRLINCQVEITRQFYPKAPAPLVEGEFGIVVGKVLEWDRSAHEPQLHPLYKTITIKSDRLPDIKVGDGRVYYLKAYECESDYGVSYLVQLMTEKVSLETEEEQRAFLKRIISEKQVDALFRTFKNPIEVIQQGTIEQLMTVEGIGQKKAEKLIEKVLGTQDMSVIFTELDSYGLTQREINQLVSHFKDPRMVVTQMKQNPYVMIDVVDRVGFLRADEVAIKGGFSRKSPFRICAYIHYYLDQQAEAGNSWVSTEVLVQEIQTYFKEEKLTFENISKALKKAVKDFMWHNEDKTRVGLRSVYELEEEIAVHLKRLLKAPVKHTYEDWEAKVKEQEARQGWTYTEEQKEAIKCILNHNVSLIQGVAGCVDQDTEYFNGTGWKKISDYEAGEKVLQYQVDGTASLVEPIAYIKQPQDTLYHIKTKYGVDQCLSLEHDVVYETSRGNLKKKPLKAIKEQHEQTVKGFSGKFRTTFDYEGEGMSLSLEEIRVMVAVMADGNFHSGTNHCYVNLKKEAKKERLTKLLIEAGIEFKVIEKANGYHLFKFYAPRREKSFGGDWYQCNKEQLQVILEEVLLWDGSTKGRLEYFTTDKSSADFVQFVASACGYRATVRTYDRTQQTYRVNGKEYIRKSIEYVVGLTTRTTVGIGGFKANAEKVQFKEYQTLDGYEYCFNVPSEMLVLRRNGRIFITGNCGKTSSVSAVLNIFEGRYTVEACALAGKAAVNISDSASANGMKINGSTIHRLLKVSPLTGGFEHNEKNPLLTDIIIVDEVGMIGAELFCSLLRAIKTGAKVIFLGDIGQLEAIGKGNVFMDMLTSTAIPSVSLNQVHRQAEKSAIVMESLKVRNKQAICKSTDQVVEVRGELQDLVMDLNREKEAVFPKVIDYYFKEWDTLESKNPMDLQVITAMKERGMVSVYPINNAIQERLMKGNLNQPYIVNQGKKNEFKIYVGDKVLNNQNCYETVDVNYNPCPIFNGNLGIVQHIDHQSKLMLVDFQNVGLVRLGKEQIDKLTLGYAITVHKCITKDTMIYTEAGLHLLEDFNNHPLPLGQKVLRNPLRVWNGWTLETPSHFYNAGASTVHHLTCEGGATLTATLDHKLMVLEDGQVQPKEVKDIQMNDLVLVGGRVDVFGKVSLTEEEIMKRVRDGLEAGSLVKETNELNRDSFLLFLVYLLSQQQKTETTQAGVKFEFPSSQLAKEVQLLLWKVGVDLEWKGGLSGSVEATLSLEEVAIFCQHLLHSHVITEEGWLNSKLISEVDLDESVVKYSGEICHHICQLFNIHWTKRDDLTRLELAKFIQDFGYKMSHLDLFRYLVLIFNNLKIKRVVKIEEGWEETYCLSMPCTKRFVQNGIHGFNCQGSGIDTVIFATTSSDYVLLNKELIYTALTRCRKKGIVVAESKALRSACLKSSLSTKQTFLTQLLDQ